MELMRRMRRGSRLLRGPEYGNRDQQEYGSHPTHTYHLSPPYGCRGVATKVIATEERGQVSVVDRVTRQRTVSAPSGTSLARELARRTPLNDRNERMKHEG